MVMSSAYEKYKVQEITTADPMALIVMLYSGCIKQLKLARMAIAEKKYEDANTSLKKAQDIIAELMISLDFKYDVSKELMEIYTFIHSEIISINVAKDADRIEPVIKLLSGLREAWVKVEKQLRPVAYEISEIEQ